MGTVRLRELNSIELDHEKVTSIEKYGGVFKKGEKVLKLHYPLISANEYRAKVKDLLRTIPNLREMGYAGVYADTSQPAFHHLLERHGAREIHIPIGSRIWAKIGYIIGIPFGFRLKKTIKPVKRHVLRFEWMQKKQKNEI